MAEETSIWKDPQFWQIMLGQLGQAIAGEHQESWQAQLGGATAKMGQAQKMAQAEETGRAESRKRWEQLFGKLGGGETTDWRRFATKPGDPAAADAWQRFGPSPTPEVEKPPLEQLGEMGEVDILQRLLGGYGAAAEEYPGY